MESPRDGSDVYESQLKDVYDSCDRDKSGVLGEEGLKELCQRLQFGQQAAILIQQLTTHQDPVRVTFEEFKDAFLNVLEQTQELSSDSDYDDDEQEYEESYHTCSKSGIDELLSNEQPLKNDSSEKDKSLLQPFSLESANISNSHATESACQDSSPEVVRAKMQLEGAESYDSDGSPLFRRKRKHSDDLSSVKQRYSETFEAEGQLNQEIADVEQNESSKEQLREAWKTVEVGSSGFIDIQELSKVCEYFGVENDDKGLHDLFDKLDVNQDGLISFAEFVEGLRYTNTALSDSPSPVLLSNLTTPIRPVSRGHQSLSSTPRLLLAQKKIRSSSSGLDEKNLTPSQLIGSSDMFTCLPGFETGYSLSDDLIEFWETFNVANGRDILMALGFELKKKICLSELSFLLEQELMLTNNDNAIYQAAMVTYREEIRHMSSTVEQLKAEKSKLQHDLNDANSRSALLAKETDERHAQMEKTASNQMKLLEAKHQDQLKQLRNEADIERENFLAQESKLKLMCDRQYEDLKGEEAHLKDKLIDADQEIEKLKEDLDESAEKYLNAAKQIERLHKELESKEELQTRIAELESRGADLDEKQRKSYNENLERLRMENKDLRDKNDVLTAEVEHIKQLDRPRSISPTRLSADCSEDDFSLGTVTPLNLISARRRKLPSTPSVCLQNSFDGSMWNETSWQIIEMKDAFEKERTILEETFEARLNDSISQHKLEMLEQQKTLREKEELDTKCQAELAKEIKRKEGIIEVNQAEIWDLSQKLEETEERLNELHAKLHEEKGCFEKALFERNSKIQLLEEAKLTATLQMEELYEDLRVRCNEEKIQMEDYYSEKMEEIKKEYLEEIEKYEQMCSKGVEGLEGKLREDFYKLLESFKEGEKQKLNIQLEDTCSMENEGIGDSQNSKVYEEKIETLEKEVSQVNQALEEERDTMDDRIEKERQNLEETLAESIREELNSSRNRRRKRWQLSRSKDEFSHQMDQLRETFADERRTIESQNILLEEEIDELKMLLSKEETAHKKSIEELNRKISRLLEEKKNADKVKEECEDELFCIKRELSNTKIDLQDKIDKLLDEKEQVLSLVQVQKLESDQSLNFKEKVELESLVKEKEVMTSQIANLYSEIDLMQEQVLESKNVLHENSILKTEMDKLLTTLKENGIITGYFEDVSECFSVLSSSVTKLSEEKKMAEEKLSDLQIQQAFSQQFPNESSLNGNTSLNEDAQKDYEETVREKNSLQRQVNQLQQQLEALKSVTLVQSTKDSVVERQNSKDVVPGSHESTCCLKDVLVKTTDELVKKCGELMALQEKHLQEIQSLRQMSESMVDVETYNRVQINLVEQKRKFREVQQINQKHTEASNSLILELEVKAIKSGIVTGGEMDKLKRQLDITQEMLRTQTEKLKLEYEGNNKTNKLLTELFVEKANLVQDLTLAQEQQKNAENRCFELEAQCNALQRAVVKVARTANKFSSP